MRNLLILLFWGSLLYLNAQDADRSFREDQLYLSVSYPFFSQPHNELIQNKLSYSISMGFIRDMPINNSRTLALGIGLGWNHTTVFNNSRFQLSDSGISSSIIQGDYQQNQLEIQSLMVPFELRWRNATATKHAFWRIHTGIGVNVPIKFRSLHNSNGIKQTTGLPSNDVLLGWNLHFGFNTWNISILHDLQPLAISATSNGDYGIKFTRIGLIFYIL